MSQNNVSQMHSSATQAANMPLSPTAVSLISYFFGIFAIVALFLKPYDKNSFVRFHAWQSILLNVTGFVASMVSLIVTGLIAGIVAGLLGYMNLYGAVSIVTSVPSFIAMMLGLAVFCGWIYAVVGMLGGKKAQVPIIGGFAENLAAN